MKLLGSGVVCVPPVLMVNDSEGTVPTRLSKACEGQPGELQPTPLFSSQYTGSPLGTDAFSRLSQYKVPAVTATFKPLIVTRSTSKPCPLLEMNWSVRFL